MAGFHWQSAQENLIPSRLPPVRLPINLMDKKESLKPFMTKSPGSPVVGCHAMLRTDLLSAVIL